MCVSCKRPRSATFFYAECHESLFPSSRRLDRSLGWDRKMILVSLVWGLLLAFSFPALCSAQSIPVGGAYVGCGYDVLFGNPDGASFTTGGLDPGLKAAKFVLQKTFRKQSGYCPDEATCVELGGTFGEETFSLTADLQQYQDEFSALWSVENGAGLLIANFGGTLSASYKQAKTLMNEQLKVIISARRVSIAGDVVYNTRQNRNLSTEFVDALCELPLNYSQSDYLSFLKEWGTHVVTGAKIGVRESRREEFSKKTMFNHLQKNQSSTVSSNGGILAFISSSITGSISDLVVDDLRSSKEAGNRFTSAIGSPLNPAPISLTLRGIDRVLNGTDIIKAARGHECPALQNPSDVNMLRANVQRALTEYPTVLGAEKPAPLIRTTKLAWPKGTYSLLMANEGCPEGVWSNGSRYHDTIDRYPNNLWSDHFSELTPSSLWSNNVNLQFCTKLLEFDDSSLDWPQGAYCIFKKAECPTGFEMGTYYVDDEYFFNGNGFSGILPDGEFNKKTKYFFCCREDGSVNKPIFLPSQKPFFLLPIGPACQVVDGMESQLHWLKMDTMYKGWTTMTGKHPYGIGDTKSRWSLYFCYYRKIIRADQDALDSADSNGHRPGFFPSMSNDFLLFA